MIASILIPLKSDTKFLPECVESCLRQEFQDFEIIILPDSNINLTFPKAVIIPTGELTPPKKRDIGLAQAKGEIIAFLDDDTVVSASWLKNALANFQDPEVAAVGGPAITPDSDNLKQRASGKVYESILVSGKFRYRYSPIKRILVDDYPSCNFIARKSILDQLGGFNTNYWPGEDTVLCLDIVKKLGKKIVYDPTVLIYHHRREVFIPHLKQIAGYALHRGYFVKKFSQTSFKISYFLPSFLLFWVVLGALLLSTPLAGLYLVSIFTYLIACLMVSIQKEIRLTPFIFIGIIFTHLAYGFYFIKGLLSRRLQDESICE